MGKSELCVLLLTCFKKYHKRILYSYIYIIMTESCVQPIGAIARGKELVLPRKMGLHSLYFNIVIQIGFTEKCSRLSHYAATYSL